MTHPPKPIHTACMLGIRGRELDPTWPVATALGLSSAVGLLALALVLSKEAGFQLLAVQLGFVGAVYFGFAVADGRVGTVIIELSVATVFLFVGAGSLWADSPVLLAAGYGAHGLWDFAHHPAAIATDVRRWYLPFCVVFDWVLGAFILVRF